MQQCFSEEYRQETFFDKNVQLVYASKIDECDSIYPRVMHSHEDLVEILLITSGKGNFFIKGVYYEVKQGDIVVFNSGVIHDELLTQENAISLYCCALKNLKLKGLRKDAVIPDDCCPVIPTGEHFNNLLSIFSLMFSILQSKTNNFSAISQELSRGLLHYLKGNILEPHIIEDNNTSKVLPLKIREYIDRNYTEDIQLQKIAEELDISLYYLSHVFKDMFGYSPGNYIVRRRIGEAQTLLITTNDSVINIASRVGYNNVSHFNTLFKKLIGMTPKQYRKSYLEKERS